MTGLNQLVKRTFRTEWTHPRLHCSIQVALSLSAESATCLQQCPRLNTVLPYYTLKKKWIPELQVISDAFWFLSKNNILVLEMQEKNKMAQKIISPQK